MNQIAAAASAMIPIDEAVQNPELALMRRLRRGDASAMDDLVRRHGADLRRLIGRLTGWSVDGDDILQEVLVTAWEKAAQFQGKGSLEGWLRRLAVNRCRNHHRAKNAFQRLLRNVAAWSRSTSSSDSPDDAYTSALEQALLRLSANDRTVLVLYYWEALRGEEVAEAMQIRVEAVHMRLHRARARLREILEHDEQFHGPR